MTYQPPDQTLPWADDAPAEPPDDWGGGLEHETVRLARWNLEAALVDPDPAIRLAAAEAVSRDSWLAALVRYVEEVSDELNEIRHHGIDHQGRGCAEADRWQ